MAYDFLGKKHQSPHTGAERWERDISIDTENWTDVFEMASKTCKENKLKEFHSNLFIGLSWKKERCRYWINTDNDCIHCGEPDSINHTFIDSEFTETFSCRIINWFKTQNGPNFQADTKEMLFATFKHPRYMELVGKVNYNLLSMKFYTYINKKFKICNLIRKKHS